MRSLNARILRRLRLYDRLNWTDREDVRGRRFAIPVIGGLAASASEPWMIDLIDALMAARPGAFVDVGVNLGQTLLKVAAVAPDRDYIGFEPNPACIAYVDRLIAANQLEHVRIVPVGLGAETGLLTLHLYGGEVDPAASIVAEFRPNQTVRREKIVPIFALDDARATLPDQIAVVKMDVEGAELEVMRTLQPLLAQTRPHILIEILPPYTPDNHIRIDRQTAIEALLAALDYRLFRIRHRGDGALGGIDAIDTFGVHGDLDRCDYVLAPAESTAALDRWMV